MYVIHYLSERDYLFLLIVDGAYWTGYAGLSPLADAPAFHVVGE